MVLDEVSSEMLRRKLDDARFLAMWVANETALFLADLGDEGANAERLAAFVRMVRGDLAEAVEICAECEVSLCALNCACTNADKSNVR